MRCLRVLTIVTTQYDDGAAFAARPYGTLRRPLFLLFCELRAKPIGLLLIFTTFVRGEKDLLKAPVRQMRLLYPPLPPTM